MTSRLPRSAFKPAPAIVPPAGLPEFDYSFSRIKRVTDAAGTSRTWHLLDNAERLAALATEPLGTILCVHGNPTWSYLWRRLIAQATTAAERGEPAWRVIAVDQLDMGFSERTGEPRPLAQRVRDLGDLTDALELAGPVVTLGHDWGGVVSLGWAVDHPEALSGAMLLNTAVHQDARRPIPAPLRVALGPGILGGATVASSAFLETTLSLAYPQLAPAVKDAYRAPYLLADRRGGIGGFVADIPVDDSHESWAELHRIAEGARELDVPALMLWGPRDPIFGDRYLADLIDRMPHADVHRFEGAGHLLAEDVDYATAVLGWLHGVAPAAPVAPAAAPAVAAATSTAATSTAPVPLATTRPLWRYLDEFAASTEIALVELASGRTVTWRLLSRRVRQLASGLSRVGVQAGDRVSLLVQPGADLTAVLYACLRIGAIVVVADAGLGVRGLSRAVRGATPDHIIGALPGLSVARTLGWPGQRISTDTLPFISARALAVSYSLAEIARLGIDERMPPEPASTDTAAVLFTSGSTGPAKGVVYSHAQLGALRDALATQYGVGPGTGLVAGFAPFALLGPALGVRSATPDMDVTAPGTLTARALADAVAAVAASVVFLSPAAVANVVATDSGRNSFPTVRTVLSAGAPVSEPLLAGIAELMPNATAHTPYGMTEALLLTDATLEQIRDAASEARPAGGVCVGRPIGVTRVLISALDGGGAAVGAPSDAPGVTGEIVVSAPHLKTSYDRLWLTDRAALRDVPPGERWHRTGDVGHLDSSGRLWVEGRMQHVMTTASGVVTPVGIEQRVETVAEVSRAAAVAVGPPGTQQIVVVVEVSGARVSLAPVSLATAVRAVAGVPVAAVLVVPVLPTDIRHNSKVDRSRLSRWAFSILAGGRMVSP